MILLSFVTCAARLDRYYQSTTLLSKRNLFKEYLLDAENVQLPFDVSSLRFNELNCTWEQPKAAPAKTVSLTVAVVR